MSTRASPFAYASASAFEMSSDRGRDGKWSNSSQALRAAEKRVTLDLVMRIAAC
jgi:hypothetical protein